MTRHTHLRWSQVKIGLLVLAAFAVLSVMILNLEEGMGLISRKTRFRAIVNHTQGLKVGGPVRMNGVDVGNVHKIAIAGDAPQVEITFAVQSEVAPHIREDASIRIRALGLLGDKFLELTPGTLSKPPLPPGSVLLGKAEMDIGSLATGASATIENVNAAIRDIQRILLTISQGEGTAGKLLTDPGLYDRSAKVIEKLEVASDKSIALLDKVNRGEGTIGQLLSDKEIYNRASQAVKELNDLATKLNNQNGTLVKLTDPTLYQRLEALTNRGEQLLRRVEKGEGTIGKLVTKDELYARADKLLSEMEEFLADVKNNPTKYFKFSVF